MTKARDRTSEKESILMTMATRLCVVNLASFPVFISSQTFYTEHLLVNKTDNIYKHILFTTETYANMNICEEKKVVEVQV